MRLYVDFMIRFQLNAKLMPLSFDTSATGCSSVSALTFNFCVNFVNYIKLNSIQTIVQFLFNFVVFPFSWDISQTLKNLTMIHPFKS